jgi:hypothetical protein
MGRLLFSAICLLMAALPRGVDGTAFVFNNMTCNSPVNLYVEKVTCGSSSSSRCNFGDLLYAEGTLGLSDSLKYSSMCSTVRACFLGSSFVCQTYEVPIDVCNDLGLKSMDGTSCPNAADYYFDAKVQLPGQGSLFLGSGTITLLIGMESPEFFEKLCLLTLQFIEPIPGWWITTDIVLANCGSEVSIVECHAKFTAVSTAESNVATSAVLLGVGFLVYVIARKRRVATIDLRKEEQFLEGNFEMMPDHSVQA